jgi:hypothetical protein
MSSAGTCFETHVIDSEICVRYSDANLVNAEILHRHLAGRILPSTVANLVAFCVKNCQQFCQPTTPDVGCQSK